MALGTRGHGPGRLAKLSIVDPYLVEQCLQKKKGARLPVPSVRQRLTTVRNLCDPGAPAPWELPNPHSATRTRASKGSAGGTSRPGRRGPASNLTPGREEPRDAVGWPRAPAATGNTRNPANGNVQLRSCGPIAGRVGGWPAWRWLPGYGAASARASCQVVAEPVRRRAGEVGGHAPAPLSLGGPGGRRAARGCARERAPGPVWGAHGAVRSSEGLCGSGGSEARGARRSRVLRRKTESGGREADA